MKILVVPSIRNSHITPFLRAWSQAGFDRIIVVEDNPKPTFNLVEFKNVWHYAWNDIDYELADKSWIIPRRTDCIRSYGFLKARDMGAEYIFTLDDDCMPIDGDCSGFIEAHIKNLNENVSMETWWPTFKHHGGSGWRPRGLPYDGMRYVNSMVNVGLWKGVPDTGAVEALGAMHSANTYRQGDVVLSNGLMRYGTYFPMCGMNLCFHIDILPAMYFTLMGNMRWGSGIMFRLPFDRFGDIWAGLFAKRVLDHLRMGGMRFGKPYVYHSRASNVYANLAKEATGICVHEELWRYVDDCVMFGGNPASAYRHLAGHIKKFKSMMHDGSDEKYWVDLGNAMATWAALVTKETG